MKTTITDRHGNIEQELSYDPWGTRRNPDTWHTHNNQNLEAPMFDRGYTGHEHLYAFGLINMNGRMYDPLTSSFLSVDAYVQSPEDAQSFNRYAYCHNNPLRYVDPSGWLMLGAGHGTSFNNNPGWGESYSQHAYEPRELGMLQLPGCSVMTWWMEGEKMLGGGGGGGGGSKPIIDPSELSQTQQESFNNSIEFTSKSSKLFNRLYEYLNTSPTVYKILIGVTVDDVPAFYNPSDNTITFKDESALTEFFAFSEELFHAFQLSENKDLYDPSLEMNYEYEAKVAKFLMHSEYGYPINVAMNDSFNYTISFLVPNGYDVAFPTAETITSEQFLQKYFEGARIYAEWNRINNYGNSNYRKATLQNPYSLFKLFK